MIKRNFVKIMNVFMICAIIFVTSGCVSGEFEVVPPPVKDYPTPATYEETSVITDSFTMEKSFRGNKSNNRLTVTSDAQTIKGFSVGEKGIVSYQYKGTTYEFDAVITACPTEGFGTFVAEYSDFSNIIPESYPGKFSIETYREDNCLLVLKTAVMTIDQSGNAVVLQIDENGILKEKNIVVGYSNDTYYQVINGLSVGEKVVIR